MFCPYSGSSSPVLWAAVTKLISQSEDYNELSNQLRLNLSSDSEEKNNVRITSAIIATACHPAHAVGAELISHDTVTLVSKVT